MQIFRNIKICQKCAQNVWSHVNKSFQQCQRQFFFNNTTIQLPSFLFTVKLQRPYIPRHSSYTFRGKTKHVCPNLETLLFNGTLRVGVLVCCIIFVVQMRILNKNGVVTSRRTVNYRHLLGVYGLLREGNKYFLATQGFGFCDLIRTTVPLRRLEWQAPLL